MASLETHQAYQWHRASPSSHGEERRRASGTARSSIEADLRQLRAGLQHLDGKVKLVESTQRNVAHIKPQEELGEASRSLQVDLVALRHASHSRFEAIEKRLTDVEHKNRTFEEELRSMKHRTSSVAVVEERAASPKSRAHASSASSSSIRSVSQGALMHMQHTEEAKAWCKALKLRELQARDPSKPDREHNKPHLFPLPEQPLLPEWEAYLNDPTFHFAFAEILVELANWKHEVPAEALHRAVRARLGADRYYELLNACGGTQRLLGCTGRFIKMCRLRHNFIHLDNLRRPFWEENHNDDFSGRPKPPPHPTRAGGSRVRSRQRPRQRR